MTYNYTGITIDKYMSNNRTSKDCSYVECVHIHISYTRKVFLVLYITNFIFYRTFKKQKTYLYSTDMHTHRNPLS